MQSQWILHVQAMIHRLKKELIQKQNPDGTWPFCFENGIGTDAYYVLLHQVLKRPDPGTLAPVLERILDKQTGDGTWKAFPDEKEGNVSATLRCLPCAFVFRGENAR